MNKAKRVPGLILSTDRSEYQVISDGQHLYFVRLGSAGHADHSKCIRTPKEYQPDNGNHLINWDSVEGISCVRSGRKIHVVMRHGGHVSRFWAKDSDEDALHAVFGAAAEFEKPAGAKNDEKAELALLIACLVTAVLRVILSSVPAVSGAADWIMLVWIILPAVWVAMCARRPGSKLSERFPMGTGMIASLFACVFLWISTEGSLENWTAILLPAIIGAIAVTAIYCIFRRRLDSGAAMVFIVTLIFYAPCGALALNEILPAQQVENLTATVLDVSSEYSDGDWDYYAVVELEDMQVEYTISRDEYASLSEGSTVQIVHTVGALGMEYTDLVVGETGGGEDASEDDSAEDDSAEDVSEEVTGEDAEAE